VDSLPSADASAGVGVVIRDGDGGYGYGYGFCGCKTQGLGRVVRGFGVRGLLGGVVGCDG
jgi:hypothetical protein